MWLLLLEEVAEVVDVEVRVVVVVVRIEDEADEEYKELDIVVEPQVDGEGAMEEGIGEAGDVWKVGH